MIDYNSTFGGPWGGINSSASKLFSLTRNSSTLKKEGWFKSHLCVHMLIFYLTWWCRSGCFSRPSPILAEPRPSVVPRDTFLEISIFFWSTFKQGTFLETHVFVMYRAQPKHIPGRRSPIIFSCSMLPSSAWSSAGTKVPSPWNHHCYTRTLGITLLYIV